MMFSMGIMNHQYLPLFLASCFFFISLSQTSSNTSSHHHCLPDQSAHLLQLRQEFVERNYSDYSDYYDYYNGSYPKMKSWKADSDCCSWDGITCDTQNGEVIGLDLSNSWLYGPLNSNSSLFSLRHLRKLNLDSNNFSSSIIPSEFGLLVSLTHLNLSFSFLHGRIPSEISWLSNLVSLDLSFNYFKYNVVGGYYHYKLLDLRRIDLEALVQNMTYLRELHLDCVNISSEVLPPPTPKKPPTQECPPPPPPPASLVYVTGPPGTLYPIDENFNGGSQNSATVLPVLVSCGLLGLLAFW